MCLTILQEHSGVSFIQDAWWFCSVCFKICIPLRLTSGEVKWCSRTCSGALPPWSVKLFCLARSSFSSYPRPRISRAPLGAAFLYSSISKRLLNGNFNGGRPISSQTAAVVIYRSSDSHEWCPLNWRTSTIRIITIWIQLFEILLWLLGSPRNVMNTRILKPGL
jgi:hypothetical protein